MRHDFKKKYSDVDEALAKYEKVTKQNFKRPGGICFGASLCYSVFDCLGMMEWWTAVVENIASWDRKDASLNKLVKLPQSNKELTLDSIFKMAAYFLLNHNDFDLTKDNFDLTNISNNESQLSLLKPGSKLRITTDTGTKQITARLGVVLHGNKDLEVFIEEFQKQYRKNKVLCLVFSDNHTTAIRGKNKLYFFNYAFPGWTNEAIVIEPKEKRNKIKDFWSYLYLRQYNRDCETAGIIMCSLDGPFDQDFIATCDALNRNSLNHLDSHVIHIMCNMRRDFIPEMLNKLENDSDAREKFASALLVRDLSSPTTLQAIIEASPSSVHRLLNILTMTPLLLEKFAETLPQTLDSLGDIISSCDNRTTVDMLQEYVPDAFPQFLDIVNNHPVLHASFVKCLLHKDKQGKMFLDRLVEEGFYCLPKLFELIQTNEPLKAQIESILGKTINSYLPMNLENSENTQPSVTLRMS